MAGIADDTTRVPDVAGTLAQVDAGDDAPVLVLAHDPATFADVPRHRVALTLCGHTHGGQVRLPFYGPLVVPGRAPRRWSHGLVEEGGRRLLVSAGVGTSVLPVRLGAPPEIVLAEVGGG